MSKAESKAERTLEEEIAKLAYQLWRERGCPAGSAEENWFEAEEQLRVKSNSESARAASPESGSVQH